MLHSSPPAAERLAKRIAHSGLCSRRDAERLIAERAVTVNGVLIATPATLVTPQDEVRVWGKALASGAPARLWRYHKPAGLVTTHQDPEGRPTVFASLPKDLPRVLSIGRLDLATEGLLLLTTDGALARRLELPATGLARRYRVRLYGPLPVDAAAQLAAGMTLDGVHYAPVTLREESNIVSRPARNAWVEVTLREGKNREIRKLFEALGCSVSRLIRTHYGPFALEALATGALEEVPPALLSAHLDAL